MRVHFGKFDAVQGLFRAMSIFTISSGVYFVFIYFVDVISDFASSDETHTCMLRVKINVLKFLQRLNDRYNFKVEAGAFQSLIFQY